jgi:hypothetical protein
MLKLLCLALFSFLINVLAQGCNAELQPFNSLPERYKFENGLRDINSSEIMNKIMNNEPINYSYVNISGDLDYKSIDRPIKQRINIVNSKINDNVYFGAATFEDVVYFSNITFRNNIYFGGTRFEREAYFLDTIFLDEAYFRDAKFIRNAFFVRDRFDTTKFDFAEFEGNAYFQNANFEKMASFTGVQFNGDSFFNNVQFIDMSYFKDASFSHNTQFDESKFYQYAYFGNTQFAANAYFERSIFEKQADFTRAQFDKNAFFEGTKFLGNTYFTFAKFGGDALFYDATINKNINLSKTKFDRIYIDWNYIKNNLDYDGAAYLALRKSYNDLDMFDSADQCYYEYREKSRILKPWGWSKLVDTVAWLSCGYGKKPGYTLAWFLIVIVGFGLIFWNRKGIAPESRLKDAFYFSLMNFIGASTDVKAIGSYKYLVSIERILGWLFLALFLVTLGAVMIR